MNWTTRRPTIAGYDWVEFENWDIHQQGPMVFDIEFYEGDMILTDPGGDYMRLVEQVEAEQGPILWWSDEAIKLPEGGEK